MLNTVYNLMESKQPNNTVYLDPITSEYYTQQTIRPAQNNMGGYMGMGGYQQNNGYMGMGGIGRNNNRMNMMPQTIRTNTGQVSMVNKMMQNRQPYQYNVPSIAQMFPSMAMPSMDFSQYTGGAGRFLGGLLGSNPMAQNVQMPTPVSTMAVK